MLSGVSQNIGCVSARQKQKPRLDNVQQELTGIADVLSGVLDESRGAVKCRWFFGRVFSFPLVEEFV